MKRYEHAERPNRFLNVVAQDMLLAHNAAALSCEETDSFYAAFSHGSCRDATANYAPDVLHLEQLVVPGLSHQPCLMKSFVPVGDAIIGYEHIGRSAVRLSGEGTPTLIRPVEGTPLSSVHVSGDVVSMLAGDGSAIWQSDPDMDAREFVKVAVALEPGSTILQADASGLVLISTSTRTISRFDSSMCITDRNRLAGNSIIRSGAAYREGVLLVESFQGGGAGGNLLYCPLEGAPVHLAGGLFNPTHVSVFERGVLVCDFAGLHVFFMEGFEVVKTVIIPWRPLLTLLGQRRGVGYEAFACKGGLYIAFRFNVLLTAASLKYGIAYFSQSNLF